MPTQLQPYNETHKAALMDYELPPEQLQFTALPHQVFSKIAERNQNNDFDAHPIVILYNNLPVGFFVLDYGKDKFDYTENKNALLLRSLSLKPEYQNKGIAKEAMLLIPEFVQIHFADKQINEIVLAVNFENKSAYQFYLRVHYIDNGRTFLGPRGWQNVMSINV